jgi:hypothetical protein
VCVELFYYTSPSIIYPAIHSTTLHYLLIVRMSVERTELEKFIEQVLNKFMDDKAISEGVQTSSTRGLQDSHSTGCRSKHANPTTEKRSIHHDDLANAKKIPSILPDYIPPLAGTVNCDNIPQDFEYTLITTYILKGIHVEGTQLGQIPTLKNNDFNLSDRKNYAMLVPHKYLMKTTGKKACIVSQPCIKELSQSMIVNVMKIPHFG